MDATCSFRQQTRLLQAGLPQAAVTLTVESP